MLFYGRLCGRACSHLSFRPVHGLQHRLQLVAQERVWPGVCARVAGTWVYQDHSPHVTWGTAHPHTPSRQRVTLLSCKPWRLAGVVARTEASASQRHPPPSPVCRYATAIRLPSAGGRSDQMRSRMTHRHHRPHNHCPCHTRREGHSAAMMLGAERYRALKGWLPAHTCSLPSSRQHMAAVASHLSTGEQLMSASISTRLQGDISLACKTRGVRTLGIRPAVVVVMVAAHVPATAIR